MTTALMDCAATSGRPFAAAMPAAANGTSMKPPCAIDEYASIRTMFVCRNAARLPNVIEVAASTHTAAHQEWAPAPSSPRNPK